MATVIDSGALIAPAAIRDAGHIGAFGYLSTSRPGTNFTGKPITHEWVQEMQRLNLEIISCWQYGKDATADWRRGFNGGVADARAADGQHRNIGGPEDAPIFFAVDNDIDWDDFSDPVYYYLQGINSVIGVERTGVYGHANTCIWAADEGLIGRAHTDSKFYAWQTRAWSNRIICPQACVFQNIVDTQSNPGPIVGGSRVDVNDIFSADFGQWNFDRGNWDGILTQMMGYKA